MDQASLGRKGGLKRTEEQQLARKRNILKALAKRHPRSVRIQQELQRLVTDVVAPYSGVEWEMFACANCEDRHRPDKTCYCGCRKWERGARILEVQRQA